MLFNLCLHLSSLFLYFVRKPSRSKIKECWISSNLENVQYCAQTFSFCSLFVGQQEAAMNFSSSKDSTNRSNNVGNLSILVGLFEKKPLIKERRPALKAFKLHLSKGYKNKRNMTFEKIDQFYCPCFIGFGANNIHFTSFHWIFAWKSAERKQ